MTDSASEAKSFLTMIKKIKVQTSENDKFLTECKDAVHLLSQALNSNSEILILMQIVGSDCQTIEWTSLLKAKWIEFSLKTVAVVVNFVNDWGAICMYEKEGDKYVNIVETEEAGNMVIISWENTWWYRVSGSLWVEYIITKDAK